jgi:hypothetical protein
MTEVNQGKVPMPGLMEADEAARRIVRALRRGRKVYDFPWPMMVLTKWLLPWAPDWALDWAMAKYAEKPPMP